MTPDQLTAAIAAVAGLEVPGFTIYRHEHADGSVATSLTLHLDARPAWLGEPTKRREFNASADHRGFVNEKFAFGAVALEIILPLPPAPLGGSVSPLPDSAVGLGGGQ